MPINPNLGIIGAGVRNWNTPTGVRGPGTATMGVPQTTNNQLNELLMSAATFVHNATPRAGQLGQTLTNMQSVFDRVIATSEDTEVLRVRSFTGRTVPEFSVQIDQIATTQRNEGTNMTANNRDMPAGTYRFEIEIDGTRRTISFTTNEALTNRAFQQRMAEAINQADIGISASVTTANNSSTLNLETATTGAGANGEPRFTITDVQGNAVEATGVDNITREAQDAIFSVNGGDPQTSASNDVNLSTSLGITLVGPSDIPVSIVAGRDNAGMRSSTRQMVNQFNALLDTARANSADSRTRMLVRNLEATIRRNRRSLQEAGISMNDRGVLVINEEKLNAASENGALERALGSRDGRQNGFVQSLSSLANSVNRSPMRHISPHASRLPGFNMALHAVANGNSLANQAPPNPFDNFTLHDMIGNLFNAIR
jgi:flagellar capping protein FliD